MMKKLSLLLFLIVALVACGKKGDPRPKATLDIPLPEWVELELYEEGVRIVNASGDYGLMVERTVSEIGDLTPPSYKRLIILPPMGEYLDNTTVENQRYNYRFSTEHAEYFAYSAPIVRTVSFIRQVKIEKADVRVTPGKMCLDLSLSSNVARYDIYINGRLIQERADCYPLPAVPKILLLLVPYSEAGIPGTAYSATLDQDLSGLLLPPANVQIIRTDTSVVLTWNRMPHAALYKITSGRTSVTTDTNIYAHPIEKRCTAFTLVSIDASGKESAPLTLESCP